MKKAVFLFSILIISTFSLFGQEIYILRGQIVDQKHEPIRNVHVINRSAFYGTSSNNEGFFQIPVTNSDSLLVTCVGYKPFLFLAPVNNNTINHDINITLVSDTIFLQETLIRPFPSSWSAFKQEVTQLKLTEPIISKVFEKLATPVYSPKGGLIMPGPVSILYSLFSKEAKQARKMEEINHFESIRTRLFAKVSKESILKIYHLSSELELDNFLFYCNLPDEFILRAPAYDIVVKLNECYLEYSK